MAVTLEDVQRIVERTVDPLRSLYDNHSQELKLIRADVDAMRFQRAEEAGAAKTIAQQSERRNRQLALWIGGLALMDKLPAVWVFFRHLIQP